MEKKCGQVSVPRNGQARARKADAEKLLSNNISTKANFIIAYRITHIACRILPAYSRIPKVPISTLSKHAYTTMSGEITHPTIKGS